MSTLSTQLTWSHYTELLPIKDNHKLLYYLNLCTINNLDVRREKIKSKEYERSLNETKEKLITEAGSKYGEKSLKEYSNKLTVEFGKNIMREH